jgi:NCAIR mutase (PurE)-related protein
MDSGELNRLFDAVWKRELKPDEALARIKTAPYDHDIEGVAKVDLHRHVRCGFPEVVFGPGKTDEQIVAILRTLLDHGQGGLVTRIEAKTGERLEREFHGGFYHSAARTFRVPSPVDPGPKMGRVVIVTAGTSDLPVAHEARVTAEAWNCDTSLIADRSVAGLHRLLNRLGELEGADAIVVVAGMEGALPSVVGGQVSCPVIAVPTSVGYGASLGGLAALLGMLNSCSSNVVTVNIDGGFNGGYVAGLIARRAGAARNAGTASSHAHATENAIAADGSKAATSSVGETSGAGSRKHTSK